YLAFGTPGGDQQDQWSLNFFLNHVHFGMNLQQAIDAAEFQTRHFPSSFYPRESAPRTLDIEARVGEATVSDLRRRGHQVTVTPPPPPTPAACRATPPAADLGVLRVIPPVMTHVMTGSGCTALPPPPPR